MLTFFLLSLLAFHFNLAAQANCNLLPALIPGNLEIYYENPAVRAQTESQLESLLAKIRKISRGHFQLPKQLDIKVSGVANYPDAVHGLLRVGRQIRLNGAELSNPKFFKTMVAHEYGHAVLHENLSISPKLAMFFSEEGVSYVKTVSFNQYFRAYDELFADFMSAIEAEDPEVVTKIIAHQAQSSERNQKRILQKFFKISCSQKLGFRRPLRSPNARAFSSLEACKKTAKIISRRPRSTRG